VIASLNGTTKGGWLRYAKQIQQAGADALELNIYYIPTDANVTGEQVEQQYIELVEAIRAEVRIPLAVKLGPYFSSMANMGRSWTRRAPTGWCCSIAFTNRITISRRSRWCRT